MLTNKELDILLRRAKGEQPSEIATALNISRAAVSQFETKAKQKLAKAEETLELVKNNGIDTKKEINGWSVNLRDNLRGEKK